MREFGKLSGKFGLLVNVKELSGNLKIPDSSPVIE